MGRRPVPRITVPLTAVVALTAGAAVLPLSAAFAAPVATAGASETFIPGTGTATSSIARVSLRSAGLSVGVGLGQARTRFAGSQGNAEAESVDLGLLGTLSKAPIACGVTPGALFPEGSMPTAVVVSSGGGAPEKRTASLGAGTPVEFGTQYGKATPNSSADAAVEGAKLDLAGIATATGGVASSAAKLTPGKQREATASSGLGKLSLAAGLVELDGLRWTATHRTGARADSAAGFAIGSITVAGQSMPASTPAELTAALDAVNTALAGLGISVHAPTVSTTATGIAVSPLRVTVSATPQMRTALSPALEAVQPLRTQLLELAGPLQATPDCGLAKALGFGYLVADLALVALGENGGVDLDLGGARAGTEFATYANPFAVGLTLTLPGLPAAPVLPGGSPTDAVAVPGLTPPAGGALPGAVPGSVPGAVPGAAPQIVEQLSPVSIACRSTHADGDGCAGRHGELAAWIVLCLVVALAAADRLRSMRT